MASGHDPTDLTTIVVCDDEVSFRVLLRAWLRDDPKLTIIADGADAAMLVPVIRDRVPTVILLDSGVPGPSTADVVATMRDASPESKILLVSAMPTRTLAKAVEEHGADGGISKGDGVEAIAAAIRAIDRE